MRLTEKMQDALAVTRGTGIAKHIAHMPRDAEGAVELTDGQWRALLQLNRPLRLAQPPHAPFGLGDAVAALANPIARALDATLGTKIVGCGGCAQRQAALNKLLPNLGKVNKSDGQ